MDLSNLYHEYTENNVNELILDIKNIDGLKLAKWNSDMKCIEMEFSNNNINIFDLYISKINDIIENWIIGIMRNHKELFSNEEYEYILSNTKNTYNLTKIDNHINLYLI